jgi:uncharacterized SAM-binding protein YcdF (DUF218 family)
VSPFDIVKYIGGPGSLLLLAVLCTVGLVGWRLWPKSSRFAQRWFAAVGILYVVLALPVTAEAIQRLLPRPSARDDPPPRVDEIVVFDGDNRRGRLATTLALWRSQHPERIVVSGEPWLVEQLVDAGVPSATIERERNAGTTREQVVWLADTLRKESGRSVLLVVSRLQAARVEALLDSADIHVPIAAAPLDAEPATESVRRFVPSYTALRLSRDALYEYLALKYYRTRGWIGEMKATSALSGPVIRSGSVVGRP